MYITNITHDYNDILSLNNNCTNSENKIEIVIPLIIVIPCGFSLICLISLMVYTLFKALIKKNIKWIHTNIRVYRQIC